MPPARRPANEAERLAALRSYEVLDSPPDPGLDSIVALASRLTGCPIALVSLLDADRQWCLARHGWEPPETPRDQTFCAHAILHPAHPLVVPDARQDARFADHTTVTGPQAIRCYAGMPLVNQDGHALGTLCILDRQPRTFPAAALETLAVLAHAVMTTLELRRTAREVRSLALSAEDRLARMIEASPTALLLTGPAGRIVLVNRQAEQMFGHDRAAMIGQPLELLMPHRFRHHHGALHAQFRANMRSRMIESAQGLFGLRADGTEFPLEIGLNPINFDGQAMVLAGLIDITARRAVEQEVARQQQELQRSNAELEEFANVASHDLKAPLRAIAHLVQWIGDDIEPTASPETIDNLRLLRGRVTHLQRLLDGLLAYSRVGRGESPIEQVDLDELLRDVVALLAPPPGFQVLCEDASTTVRTHRAPLQVVLENLVGNALRHHDRDAGRIAVGMRMQDGMAEFRVSDDGPGIPPRLHDRIFEIFQSFSKRNDQQSSGIGLAIVKKQVQANGGRIHVESAPPARGATFVFTWREATA